MFRQNLAGFIIKFRISKHRFTTLKFHAKHELLIMPGLV